MIGRHIFHEERRDWSWWENLRQYVHANGNSGYVTIILYFKAVLLCDTCASQCEQLSFTIISQ